MCPSLENDIRQFFAYGVLSRLDRLQEARVRFSFDYVDVYLSAFHQAITRVDGKEFQEYDIRLAELAKVFEQFAVINLPGVAKFDAGFIAASFYWLSGYSANAMVLAKILRSTNNIDDNSADLLLRIFERDLSYSGDVDTNPLLSGFLTYVQTGDEASLGRVIATLEKSEDVSVATGDVNGFISSRLALLTLRRFQNISIWKSIENKTTAPHSAWQNYITYQLSVNRPIVDLWPSQRKAIDKGLLDSRSSIVITTPTSSGKTKMTELAFVNDLSTDETRKCLYIAPFRALVGEIETDIGSTFAGMGFPVVSLYGGSDANEIEVELTSKARITIATPEKINAVLRLGGGKLSDYRTIVLDEGHLLDSTSRGTSYEFQIASLRSSLAQDNRIIFLSAVLPNSNELAIYLSGDSEKWSYDDWQPTSIRIGVISWPKNGNPLLDYMPGIGQALTENFFVPRPFEQEVWKEVNPVTHRENTFKFPEQRNNADIAAALAFQYLKSGPVIIYATRPDWTTAIAKAILKRLSSAHPITTNLVDDSNRKELENLANFIRRSIGECTLADGIERGFAIHHGGIPQSLRFIIEDAYRKQKIKLLIATNTIAQGVNFPAKTVIVHSLPRTDAPIRDFWNLVGRAGRANKETEGEVLILQTGSLTERTLRQFLDKKEIESVNSQILALVQKIAQKYLLVSPETINAFQVEDDDDSKSWRSVIRAIDSNLLDFLAEDAKIDQDDPIFTGMMENLFALFQATRSDIETGSELAIGVRTLLQSRRRSILERIPDGTTRKYFAKTGLSVESSIQLYQSIADIQLLIGTKQTLDANILKAVVLVACRTTEMETVNGEVVADVAFSWIQTGNYAAIFREYSSRDLGNFQTLDNTVSFIDDIICYRLPWVINGILRLLETSSDGNQNPDWFTYLPQFLQYGVNTKELVWVSSLGIQQREFAEFILRQFVIANKRLPINFKVFLNWLIANRDSLLITVQEQWPHFFSENLTRIIFRYERLRNQLD